MTPAVLWNNYRLCVMELKSGRKLIYRSLFFGSLIAFSLIPSLHPEISESRRSFNYSSLEIYIFGDQTINHTSKTFSRQIPSLFNLSSVSKNNSFITDRCLDSGALCRWHFNRHFTYLSDLCSVRSALKKKHKRSSRSPGGAEHIQLPCLFSSILALLAWDKNALYACNVGILYAQSLTRITGSHNLIC